MDIMRAEPSGTYTKYSTSPSQSIYKYSLYSFFLNILYQGVNFSSIKSPAKAYKKSSLKLLLKKGILEILFMFRSIIISFIYMKRYIIQITRQLLLQFRHIQLLLSKASAPQIFKISSNFYLQFCIVAPYSKVSFQIIQI